MNACYKEVAVKSRLSPCAFVMQFSVYEYLSGYKLGSFIS